MMVDDCARGGIIASYHFVSVTQKTKRKEWMMLMKMNDDHDESSNV